MNATRLEIPDVIVFCPKVFTDDRGFFFESFNKRTFEEETGVKGDFVQDNHSSSVRGVVRGLHYQQFPFAQGKLVRVIQGRIFDVAVDIRRDSPTFGKWVGEFLSDEDKRQLWIPEGFAHGFLCVSEIAQVLYKTTEYYAPKSEGQIRWDDPTINIRWPIESEVIVSAKDLQAKTLAELV